MKYVHDFQTPRNIFEKLIRDSDKLDNRVSGDAIFNFILTAYHFQEWIKKSPIESTESVKRLLRKAANHKYIKLCKDIITAKVHFNVEIDDPTVTEGSEIDFDAKQDKPDSQSYEDKSKSFTLLVSEDKYDLFEFKNEIVSIFTGYFQIK